MREIVVVTDIVAPAEAVFALALDLDAHAASAAGTGERVVATTARGALREGDEVTFEGRHLGVRWRMTARIVALDAPLRFVDEQVRGPFRRFRHEHLFEPTPGGTRMTDRFAFDALCGPIVERHLRRFLTARAEWLKTEAERIA